MEKMPKIVLERLRQEAARASQETAPTPSGNVRATEHPDADLLTAFAEKKLTQRERASVLTHLANCGECRAIVALAYPSTVDEVPPVGVAARRRAWFTLPVVRWGAIATALGAVLIAVTVIRHVPQEVHEARVAETKRPLAPPPAQPSAPGKPRAAVPAANEAPTEAFRQRPPVKTEARSTATNLSQPAPKQGGVGGGVFGTGVGTGVGAPATSAGTFSASTAPAKPEPSKGYSVGGPLPSPAPTNAPGPGTEQSKAAGKMANVEVARRQSQAATDKLESAAAARKDEGLAATQSVAVTAGAAPAARAPAAFPATGGLLAPTLKKGAKDSLLIPNWSISATGKVERSVDGGKTWQELHVNDGLVFRVVTAAGNEVWAGGASGALYHSVDGGEHWVRVYLNADRSGPSDAIVGINFSDPLHGTVTTAAEERWITSDGGRHWAKQ
jgi:hypothetical protein